MPKEQARGNHSYWSVFTLYGAVVELSCLRLAKSNLWFWGKHVFTWSRCGKQGRMNWVSDHIWYGSSCTWAWLFDRVLYSGTSLKILPWCSNHNKIRITMCRLSEQRKRYADTRVYPIIMYLYGQWYCALKQGCAAFDVVADILNTIC